VVWSLSRLARAADVFAYSIKVAVDTRYTKITLLVYTSLLVVWAYTRFYVFPSVIWAVWDYTGGLVAKGADAPAWFDMADWTYFINMLYVLLFLHVYWYFLFILAGLRYARTGVTQDIQQKLPGDDEAAGLKKADRTAATEAVKGLEDEATVKCFAKRK
jgi:hypothetical protein